jgi:hypothetical protein
MRPLLSQESTPESFQEVVVSPLTPPRVERGASLFPPSENNSRSASPVPPPSEEEMIVMEANKLDAELNKVISEFKRDVRYYCASKIGIDVEEYQDDVVNAAGKEFTSKRIYQEAERKIQIANIKPSREAVENGRVALRDLKIHTRRLLKFFPRINDYYELRVAAILNGARFGFGEVNHAGGDVAAAAATVPVGSSTP